MIFPGLKSSKKIVTHAIYLEIETCRFPSIALFPFLITCYHKHATCAPDIDL